MAGGTWVTENKVRPGVYINFKSEGDSKKEVSNRGVVTMPLVLSWGAKKQVIEIDHNTDFLEVLGYELLDNELLLIKEALKEASKILAYRVNGGTKATKTSGNITVTAKYEGVRGNDIIIVIEDDIDVQDAFVVSTYLAGKKVYEQTGTTIESLKSNPYIEYSGTGTLVANAGIILESGADGVTVSGDYTDYLTSIEVFNWNTMALPVEDSTIKGATVAFIKRLREEQGKKVQAVLADYSIADTEGIISVKNGVKLADDTKVNNVKATAWVAGATAGAYVNESNTYHNYEEALDVDIRYTSSQIVEALNKGEWVFVENRGKILVEQDINTFVSFTEDKGREFRKNRVIRTLDAISNDIHRLFSDYYIGKIDNTADGRNLFKAEIIKYFEELQGINAIHNFDSATDVSVLEGNEIDVITVDVKVQPVDCMEKLYMSVTLN
ncbi:phage tail sheath family protein [Clostridium sediminicola]|uniref:phage tail sheath family protein n=1 Tax=Clostridium sediminicola TaxID=3114879 RepID=UPI0031F2078F